MSNPAYADRRHLRARKPSREQLEADLKAVNMRAFALELAYNRQADATYRHRDGRDQYVWKAYGLTRQDGGYVICQFHGFTNVFPSVIHVEPMETAILSPTLMADIGYSQAVQHFRNRRFELVEKGGR